jgi:VIT1/CCC1 family predicted Fe2+/Mn2+ transporter
MTKAIATTYTIASEYRKQLLTAFLIASAFLVLLYAFNVYSVISKTVALQKVQNDIAATGKSVESLDSAYLDIASKITPDGLGNYGFKEGKVSAYISRTAPLSRVALGGHEL